MNAIEDDLRAYRGYLVGHYRRRIVATKLAAICGFYDAALWRGLRPNNPAKGLKAPKNKTTREDSVKFLPLEGFKQIKAYLIGHPHCRGSLVPGKVELFVSRIRRG